MPLGQYVVGSTVVASGIIYHAFTIREQFFPSVVWLATSKIAMAALGNLAFAWLLCLHKLIIKVFLGRLRDSEKEHVNERLSQAIMETCLAMTIFREEFNTSFVAMFVILTFVKVFHWLLQARVEYLETMPLSALNAHRRIPGFFIFITVIDTSFIQYCGYATVTKSAGVHMLFLFEYVIQFLNMMSLGVKHIIHLLDRDMDAPWEEKGLYIIIVELATDMLNVVVYVAFFVVVFMNYGVPLHLVRDLYWTLKKFRDRMANFLRYRRVAVYMDSRFPDANEQDLIRSERVCIICREDMTSNSRNKKLNCGHVFHLRCLRSWLERQQNCPTCRAAVDPPPAPAPAPVPPVPQPPPPGPQQAAPQIPPHRQAALARAQAQPQTLPAPATGAGHAAPAPAVGPGAPQGHSGLRIPSQPGLQNVRGSEGLPFQAGQGAPSTPHQAQQAGSYQAASSSQQAAAAAASSSQAGGFLYQPFINFPTLQGSGSEARTGASSAQQATNQAQFAWAPAYSSPVLWNVPHWGVHPSMALYYPAAQYAGQERPQMAQMSMATSIPLLPLLVPPSLGTSNLSGSFLPQPPAGASAEELLQHRQALQAARAASAVASSMYSGWHDNPLMLPPSLLDPGSRQSQPELSGANQAQQEQVAAALGRAFATTQTVHEQLQRQVLSAAGPSLRPEDERAGDGQSSSTTPLQTGLNPLSIPQPSASRPGTTDSGLSQSVQNTESTATATMGETQPADTPAVSSSIDQPPQQESEDRTMASLTHHPDVSSPTELRPQDLGETLQGGAQPLRETQPAENHSTASLNHHSDVSSATELGRQDLVETLQGQPQPSNSDFSSHNEPHAAPASVVSSESEHNHRVDLGERSEHIFRNWQANGLPGGSTSHQQHSRERQPDEQS